MNSTQHAVRCEPHNGKSHARCGFWNHTWYHFRGKKVIFQVRVIKRTLEVLTFSDKILKKIAVLYNCLLFYEMK